ncbi:MAG: IS30 family transposase [Betaproteobacteria bacterium]|nr:IS30 family transposase [Betaproteobacteria bacterium]
MARRGVQNKSPGITWATVGIELGETWGPEQISGYLKVNGRPTVSHESIYQHICADKRTGGTPHRALRCQKVGRKRYGGRERRGTIPNQASTDLRPAVVAGRGRFGDREADPVIGAGQKQAIVTINGRTSHYALIAHVPFKTAQAVAVQLFSVNIRGRFHWDDEISLSS